MSGSWADPLFDYAAQPPEAPAILCDGSPPLTYGALLAQAACIRDTLTGWGFAPGDCFVSVLPEGPESAVCLLGGAGPFVIAPFTPGADAAVLARMLADVSARAVIAAPGAADAARQAAERTGVPLILASVAPGAEAGRFTLELAAGTPGPPAGGGAPVEAAIILASAGTTARPKLIPLTRAHFQWRGRAMQGALALAPEDVCLNIMDLHHAGGLICLISSAYSGGATVCVREQSVTAYLEALKGFAATYIAASPATLRALQDLVERTQADLGGVALRFIRSAAGPLAADLEQSLERVFGAPVVNVYAGTELGLIAAAPLDAVRGGGPAPLRAEAGVAIQDETGRILPPGETGEVVMRGPNVIAGYIDNPEANAAAFRDGWYRTGDLGSLDEARTLTLSGRISEVINRGGQKISPGEIDDALQAHPAVADALAFPIPHPSLGEMAGAAVVLHDGAAATERDLLDHLFAGMEAYKVPRRIVFVDDIPRGPGGKMNRQEMARRVLPRRGGG